MVQALGIIAFVALLVFSIGTIRVILGWLEEL